MGEQPLDLVLALCGKLVKDEDFAKDVRHPKVLAALDHWTGRKRLDPDAADAMFNEDFRVVSVFGKIRSLQEACARAGVGVPLDALVEGDMDQVKAALTGKHSAVPKGDVRLQTTQLDEEPGSDDEDSPTKSTTGGGHPPSLKVRPPTPYARDGRGRDELAESESEDDEGEDDNDNDEIENETTPPPLESAPLTVRAVVDKLFSMEPKNVARWWSTQIFALAVTFMLSFLPPDRPANSIHAVPEDL